MGQKAEKEQSKDGRQTGGGGGAGRRLIEDRGAGSLCLQGQIEPGSDRPPLSEVCVRSAADMDKSHSHTHTHTDTHLHTHTYTLSQQDIPSNVPSACRLQSYN